MRILVIAASKYGSTLDIARAIGEELLADGLEAEVVEASAAAARVGNGRAFDAFVIGSGVYMGAWLKEAESFVTEHQAELRAKPVWLFSSGPLGHENPKPEGDPARVPELMEMTSAREHRVFVGRLDTGRLSLGDKLIAKMVKAPAGDFRDWRAIRGWAQEIAVALHQDSPSHSPGADVAQIAATGT